MNPFDYITESNDVKYIIYSYLSYRDYNKICSGFNIKHDYIRYLDLSIKDQQLIADVIKGKHTFDLNVIDWYMENRYDHALYFYKKYSKHKNFSVRKYTKSKLIVLGCVTDFAQLNFFRFFIKSGLIEKVEEEYEQIKYEYDNRSKYGSYGGGGSSSSNYGSYGSGSSSLNFGSYGGGLASLIAMGTQDFYLTSTPKITYFKVVYKKCTNFAMDTIEPQKNIQQKQVHKQPMINRKVRSHLKMY